MYHDQGLPVLKYAGFGDAVNVTLGLPIIRTSVDHGTAFDIAGTGTGRPRQPDRRRRTRSRAGRATMSGHRARKRFGQHFLTDPGVIDRHYSCAIVQLRRRRRSGDRSRSGCTHRSSRSSSAGQLHLVELDRDLVAKRPAQRNIPRDNVSPCTKATRCVSISRSSATPCALSATCPTTFRPRYCFTCSTRRQHIRRHAFHAAERSGREHGRRTWQQGVRPSRHHARLFPAGRGAVRCAPGGLRSATRRHVLPLSGSTRCHRQATKLRDIELMSRLVATAFGQRRKTIRNSLKNEVSPEQLLAVRH